MGVRARGPGGPSGTAGPVGGSLFGILSAAAAFGVGGGGAEVYYPIGTDAQEFTSGNLPQDNLYGVPFIVQRDCRIDSFAIQVITTGMGNTVLGVYAADSVSGYPSSLVNASSVVISAPSAGIMVGAVDIPLTGGRLYWLVFCSQASAGSYKGYATNRSNAHRFIGWGQTSWTNPVTHIVSARVYDGTLPANFPAAAGRTSSTLPVVGIRLAAA